MPSFAKTMIWLTLWQRRLVNLIQEQNRTSEAFVEHQAKAHPQKGAAGSPQLGD